MKQPGSYRGNRRRIGPQHMAGHRWQCTRRSEDPRGTRALSLSSPRRLRCIYAAIFGLETPEGPCCAWALDIAVLAICVGALRRQSARATESMHGVSQNAVGIAGGNAGPGGALDL